MNKTSETILRKYGYPPDKQKKNDPNRFGAGGSFMQGVDNRMNLTCKTGNIVDCSVEAIVNPWNRNIIPWWLLLPQGVSGELKRRGGREIFWELSRYGPIPLGHACVTSAGRLPFKFIIHVAGINMFWFATEFSVRKSVNSAIEKAKELKIVSIAFPLIGSGSGNRGKQWSKKLIIDELQSIKYDGEVLLVEYDSRAQ